MFQFHFYYVIEIKRVELTLHVQNTFMIFYTQIAKDGDISFCVGVLSRYMERPTNLHHQGVKQVLRYLKGTLSYGISYTKDSSSMDLTGYSDSDMAGDPDDKKSTTGMTFYLRGRLVSWSSHKQRTVALSTCESEMMAATSVAKQGLWLRNTVSELLGEPPKLVVIFVDNKSVIALMKGPVFHGRSKHIDTYYHFIRECIERGEIKVEYINTLGRRANIFTKVLPRLKFLEMREILGFEEIKIA